MPIETMLMLLSGPISIEGEPPGSVSPGTLAGDTATQIPRTTSATAKAGASREPRGSTFSAKITTATTAIQNRLITPSTNSTAIRAPEQPTQSRPCARPLRNAFPCGALRQRRRLRRLTASTRRGLLRRSRRPPHTGRSDPRRASRGRTTSPAGRGRRPAGRSAVQTARYPAVKSSVGRTRRVRHVSRRRRRRRQHHRGGHRHPDPEVPAEPAEVGARAGVHPAHPIDRDRPRGDRAGRPARSSFGCEHHDVLVILASFRGASTRRGGGRELIGTALGDEFPGSSPVSIW